MLLDASVYVEDVLLRVWLTFPVSRVVLLVQCAAAVRIA